jgi:hypothetical protein
LHILHQNPNLTFPGSYHRWIKSFPSCSLNFSSPSRSILLYMFWTSPFNAFLSLFFLALMIGPISTSNGSLAWLRLVLGWSTSYINTYQYFFFVIEYKNILFLSQPSNLFFLSFIIMTYKSKGYLIWVFLPYHLINSKQQMQE